MRKLFFVFFFLLFFTLVAGNAAAQGGGPSDDEVNAIAKNLYCPVCENVPLDVCGTLACQQWREQIADKLAQGWNEQQIYDFFVQQYGDRVLAAPPARGLNWLIYLFPPAAILFAAFFLYRNMNAWLKPQSELAASVQAGKSDYILQLEDELEARK